MSKTSASPELLGKINELFRTLADLIRRQAQLKLDFKKKSDQLKGRFDRANTQIEEEVKSIKIQLKELIVENRSVLFSGKMKSFATLFASFSFRNVTTRFKVTDKAAALKEARRLGIMRKVCSKQVVYTMDPSKLKAYLDTHPEHFERFADYIELGDTNESLSVKPNETYHAQHDTKRLTAEAITLQ